MALQEAVLLNLMQGPMRRTRLLTCLGLAVGFATLTLSASAAAQKNEVQPVKVYVFTAAAQGGFVDDESKARHDSVVDVLNMLAKKEKTVVLVGLPEKAELTLEVLGRGLVATGNTSIGRDPLFGGVKATADKTRTLRTTLSVGDYSTEILGHGGVWRVAAGDVAGKLEKWIKANGAKIPRK